MTDDVAARDPLAALIAFNRAFIGPDRPLTDVRLKLDRLAETPLGYLRGTFHAFVADWRPADDALGDLHPQPIVGDLHLENFGAYQTSDGAVVFGINDFDDAGPGSPGFDLARLATSLVLAGDPSFKRAIGRVQDLVTGWLAGARNADAPRPEARVARKLVAKAESTSRSEWLARRVKDVRGERQFLRSVAYRAVEDDSRASVIAALGKWAKTCEDRPEGAAPWPHALDVAARTAGTGSLGRHRWAVLVAGRGGKRGKELLLELKEARSSPLAPSDRRPAARIVASQQRLQGTSPKFLGVARVGDVPCVVRELQPTQAKVQVEKLDVADLDELASTLGFVTGQAHHRAHPALAAALDGRERAVLRRTVALALHFAEATIADHTHFVAHRDEVAKALGV